MTQKTEELVVFLDNLQRTIVATKVALRDDLLVVTKPAILNVQPVDKRLQVQLYPMMFREFQKNRDQYPEWQYNRSAIVLALDLELDTNLIAQYNEIFKVQKNEPAPVIKLFDETGTEAKA